MGDARVSVSVKPFQTMYIQRCLILHSLIPPSCCSGFLILISFFAAEAHNRKVFEPPAVGISRLPPLGSGLHSSTIIAISPTIRDSFFYFCSVFLFRVEGGHERSDPPFFLQQGILYSRFCIVFSIGLVLPVYLRSVRVMGQRRSNSRCPPYPTFHGKPHPSSKLPPTALSTGTPTIIIKNPARGIPGTRTNTRHDCLIPSPPPGRLPLFLPLPPLQRRRNF